MTTVIFRSQVFDDNPLHFNKGLTSVKFFPPPEDIFDFLIIQYSNRTGDHPRLDTQVHEWLPGHLSTGKDIFSHVSKENEGDEEYRHKVYGRRPWDSRVILRNLERDPA
jgi:hypothetical protein